MHERPMSPLAKLGVRRDYVLTPHEFDALGGHSPDDLGCIAEGEDPRGWPSPVEGLPMQDQQYIRLHRCPEGFGRTTDNAVPTWEKVAERVGVHMLTVHWPDQHYPEFTAVPR